MQIHTWLPLWLLLLPVLPQALHSRCPYPAIHPRLPTDKLYVLDESRRSEFRNSYLAWLEPRSQALVQDLHLLFAPPATHLGSPLGVVP